MEEAPAASPAPVRLYSGEAIAAHTLVLTPLTGSILAAINHRRLGHRAASRRAILFFGVPSALLLVAQVFTSDGVSPLLHLAGFAWSIAVARQLLLEHQVLFAKHVAAGGQKAPWYVPTLLAFTVIVLGLLAVFASELL
jgi:hypothetical protein